MYYVVIAQIKSIVRWLAFQFGSPTYCAYSQAARETSGYDGWYEMRGRVIAFKRTFGGDQFVW